GLLPLAPAWSVAGLIAVARFVEVAALEVDARERVRGARRVGQLAGGHLSIEYLAVERRRVLRVAFERVRDAHVRERPVLAGLGRELNRFLEMLPGLLILALEIERGARPEMRVDQIRRALERLSIERKRGVLLALVVQLPSLLDAVG